MTGQTDIVTASERNRRLDTGIVWDGHPGSCAPRGPAGVPAVLAADGALQPAPARTRAIGQAASAPVRKTCGATYACDGTLEGIFTAMQLAMRARDRQAEILPATALQPRLGQEVVPVETDLHAALQMRRLVERALGQRVYHCLRTACASEETDRGTRCYRFVRLSLDRAGAIPCTRCPRKAGCERTCTAHMGGDAIDDIAHPDVFALMQLYRSVMNERHLMEQFIRFEHREGDVWFARCHPKASVVPLVMDWFVPRFNDQRFVIYDERHALSGVYDGKRWYLVKGDAITPPPPSAEEAEMQEAWRRFYRSVSVDARYHPELRRNFMPMRLWQDLTELA